MFRHFSLVSLAFAASIAFAQSKHEIKNLVIDGFEPEFPPGLKEALNPYQSSRSASFQGFSPEGDSIFIKTRFDNTEQLFEVKTPGGQRHQKTFFPEPVNAVAVSENAANPYVIFLKDINGDEDHQIFAYHRVTGDIRQITHNKAKHQRLLWLHHGLKFLYSSNERNGKDNDIYLYDLTEGKKTLVFSGSGSFASVAVSHKDKMLVVEEEISATKSNWFLVDLATAQKTPFLPQKEEVAFGSVVWSKDDSKLFFTWDKDLEFQSLMKFDVAGGRVAPVKSKLNWTIEQMDLSADGESLLVVANEDGISRVYAMDTDDETFKPIKNLPEGVIGRLSCHPKQASVFAFSVSDATRAGDIYSFDRKEESLTRWTFSEIGGLNSERFVKPELVHYRTFDLADGKNPRYIPAFVYKPKDVKGPVPVIINIHGGPESQYRPAFSPTFQFLVDQLHVAVIAPNVRGSDGYGKTYLKLDNGMLREDSVKDIGALLDWIGTQPEFDKKRVMVMGGSYGGYMVLASMVHFSDQLAGGVDTVGISNFVSFLENTRDYRRDLRRVEYGDERDPAMRKFLERISPLGQAAKIVKPLFVVQGLNDPRVPVSEAEQIVDTIRKQKNGTVWYLLAKDEGHGFQRKDNRDFYILSVAKFVKQIFGI